MSLPRLKDRYCINCGKPTDDINYGYYLCNKCAKLDAPQKLVYDAITGKKRKV